MRTGPASESEAACAASSISAATTSSRSAIGAMARPTSVSRSPSGVRSNRVAPSAISSAASRRLTVV